MRDAPHYTALSYVWGDPASRGTITCSSFEWSVTSSLLAGLRRMRHAEKVQVVWADAICIDQGNNSEKAQQVNMMGEIYDQAAEVMVWLGDDPRLLAQHAFGALLDVNEMVSSGAQRTWSVADFNLILPSGDGRDISRPVVTSRDNLVPMLSKERLEAIKKLYQVPWFTRVWVLQEVGLATKATAFWGDARIDFGEIAMFVWFAMNDHDLKGRLGHDVIQSLSGCPYSAVWNVWSTYEKKNGWIDASAPLKAWAETLASECNIDFVLVLEASRVFSATDARDHVFAFLGHPKAVVPVTGKPLVSANYEVDLDELHLRVAENLAKVSLNFLVQVQNTSISLEENSEQCSWIPRWDVNNTDAPAAFWEAWDASLRVSRQCPPPVRIIDHGLHVPALLFDKVAQQTDVVSGINALDLDRSYAEIGGLIESFWELTEQAEKAVPHKYPDNRVLAFASVLTCDHIPKTVDDTSEYLQYVIGNFSQACIYYNKPLFDRAILPLGLGWPWTAMQHRNFAGSFRHYSDNRRFFVTSRGYWGLGPPNMQENDMCAVLIGGDVPFMLRPTSSEGTFRLVGQAYVYGAMYGEILRSSEAGRGVVKEEIRIV
jgi:hypothetical protein